MQEIVFEWFKEFDWAYNLNISNKRYSKHFHLPFKRQSPFIFDILTIHNYIVSCTLLFTFISFIPSTVCISFRTDVNQRPIFEQILLLFSDWKYTQRELLSVWKLSRWLNPGKTKTALKKEKNFTAHSFMLISSRWK